jgi:hypothetical protein
MTGSPASMIDSFVTYLSDELDGVILVSYLQAHPDRPSGERLVMNALNVHVVVPCSSRGSIDEVVLSLDLLGPSQRAVLDWVYTVQAVLRSVQYTPEYVYTPDPASPAPTGVNVFWSGEDVDFERAGESPSAVQMTCTLPIRRARAS